MDMFSLSREAAQYSSMDRKTSSALVTQDAAARKQSTFDRRPSADRRQSYAPGAFNAFRDELPAVSQLVSAFCCIHILTFNLNQTTYIRDKETDKHMDRHCDYCDLSGFLL